jgi:L-2-hydroxyglutarate oxidase
VLALSREGYRKLDMRPRDAAEILASPAFWRLAGRYWRHGLAEVARSLSRRLFARSLRALVPEVRASDLRPEPAGVRAQAVLPDGTLADDFLIERSERCVHVLNAPSPAATASLAIGEYIAELVLGEGA